MSTNDKNNTNNLEHSDPIRIPIAARGRARSMSVSSSSSGSASPELPTPPGSAPSHRLSIPSSTSPILSYFLAQSPTKSPATASFPFKRKFGAPPVFEAEEDNEAEIPVAAHARRASATVASRFSQNTPSAFPDPKIQNDRGTNLMRRLSLSSSAFVKPTLETSGRAPPPNTAVSPTDKTAPFKNKPRRSATISESAKPRRAPSPMGERILKGHFDGFN